MTLTELHRWKLEEIGKIVDEFYASGQSLANIASRAFIPMWEIRKILDADECKANEEDWELERKRAESK